MNPPNPRSSFLCDAPCPFADSRNARPTPPILQKAKGWVRGSMIIAALLATVGCRPTSSNTPIQNKGSSQLEPTVEKAEPERSTALNEPVATNDGDSPKSRIENLPKVDQVSPTTPEGKDASIAPSHAKEELVASEERSEDANSSASKVKEKWSPASIDKEEKEMIATWKRFGLLLDAGPRVVDFRIAVGGQSLTSIEDKIRKEVVREFCKDESTTLEWSKLLEHPLVTSGAFKNLQANSEEQNSQLLSLYDKDRDGIANSREMVAFLTRGLSERGVFLLDEASRYRDENRDRSQTFIRLDSNRDGVLQASEVANASQRIRALDSNADHVLSLAEIRSLELNPNQYARQRQVSASNLAVALSKENLKRWTREWIERYGARNAITSDAWPTQSRLFQQLDLDASQEITAKELEGLLGLPADLVIQVSLAPPGMDGKSEWRVESNKEEVQYKSDVVETKGLRLRLRLADNQSPQLLAQKRDQLAATFGVTRTNSVDITKLASPPPNLGVPSSFDRNLDEKLEWIELEQVVLSRASLTSNIVRVRLIDVPDAWFTWLDVNWDGVLSEVELQDAPNRLQALGTDRDSEIAPESLPVQLDIVIARQFADEDPFGSPSAPIDYSEKKSLEPYPDWFVSMDSNSDGVVTEREFLGDNAAFRRLDLDHNLLLDAQDLGVSP